MLYMPRIKKEEQEEEQVIFNKHVRERMAAYIAGAFGITAALAWNEAIKAFIEYLFPFSTDTLAMKFIYAMVLTAIVGYVTMYFVRMIGQTHKTSNH